MATQEVKRKLAAILSADVKGYSRLMEEDEKGTVHTLNAYKEAMTGLIQHHRGRVVDAPGDNVLAEFGSVVDAVECAVEIQKELETRNADLPENRRMEFRIGVNLGDVIEDGEQILGDGVNIAARLESLSEAGGICISGTAFDQVENKLSLGYEFLGEQTVKNIAKPVRVYKVLFEPEAAGRVIGEKRAKPRRWQRPILALVGILVLIAAAVAVWQFALRPPPRALEKADPKKMALPLPDMPSIAVLPFANMSEDPKQEFLCDGITESIITGLSKIPRLFVIARNSTFIYKGKGVKVRQVAEELGVQYVLEGSVQRSADRIRVTAQLIDALTGNHLWAERYDRDLKDIFAVQDEITMKILMSMRVKLTEGEQVLRARPPRNLDAYLKVLQAQEYIQRLNIEGNIRGKQFAEEAIALDPEYATAYTYLAGAHMMDALLGLSKSPKESLDKAIELAQKAISLAPKDSHHYALLGYLYVLKRDYDKAIAEGEKAVALDPGGADAHAWLGQSLNFADKPKEAIPLFEKAIRLNPFGPTWYFHNFGHSYRLIGKYQEAIAQYKKALRIAPNSIPAHLGLAATYSLSGRGEEARAEAEEVLRLNPKFSLESFAKTLPFKNQDQLDRFVEALRKAGLPEKPSTSLPPSAEVAPKEKVAVPSLEKVSKTITTSPPVDKADPKKMALPLPDKPSIAVLPFVNMSGDPKKDYLSDGITEEIINALSKIPSIFVIARNSTFTYKGKPVRVQQVSEEMGVQYVMEGSVQWSGDRVRITVQLIDALKGHHLFSERYDRELKDIFALQDEITMKALMAMRVALREDARASEKGKGTKDLDAYLKLLQAGEYMNAMNKDKMALARPLVEEALALDPGNALAYAALAHVTVLEVYVGASKSPRESLDRAEELAKKALALDDSHFYPYVVLSLTYRFKKQFDKAIPPAEKAVALSPNSALACFMLGAALLGSERFEEAIPHFKKSLRLSPIPIGQCLNNLASTFRWLGRYDESIATYKKLLQRQPDYLPAHVGLAAVYVLVGRQEEARAEAAEVMRIDPQFSLERYAKTLPLRQALVDQSVEALRKAGLK